MFNDKVILITGGTGSFGKKFTGYLLQHYKPRKVIIFSRDEFKQFEMARTFPEQQHPSGFFLGDVRDRDRLYRAFDGVDYVIHAAAIKQVPAAEYNPFEAVKTNILGAQNIVEVAIDKGVKKVVALSTDKAVSPINLYGATKLRWRNYSLPVMHMSATGDLFLRCQIRQCDRQQGECHPAFWTCLVKESEKVPDYR